MGCKICTREESELHSISTKEEAQVSMQRRFDLIPTLDYIKARDQRKRLAEYASKSASCHVKMALDPGKVLKGMPINEAKLQAAFKAHYRNSESAWRGTEPETSNKDLANNPTANFGTESASIKRACTGACTGAQQSGQKEEKKILRMATRAAKKSVVAIAPSAYQSLPSLAFDHSYLVVEKKGSLFDTYKVLDLLGRGAFGVVKKVIHKSTGKIHALKVINRSCYVEVENIVNEIDVLKQLVQHSI